MTRLVLLGPPGAGKGTQAQFLAAAFEVSAISTGELFRAVADDDSQLGRAARAAMAAGRLVPDDVTNGLVARRLDAADAAAGFLLDGFPRTLDQAAALNAMLAERGTQLDAVVLLSVPEDEVVRRLSGRRVCRSCSTAWHVEFRPTREPGVCDVCGGELYQRADDAEETIRERLRVYATHTAPLIDFYAAAGLLVEVEATGPVDVISTTIATGLEQRLHTATTTGVR